VVSVVDEAVDHGCRLWVACNDVGYSVRTINRWRSNPEGDRRFGPLTAPRNSLTPEERQKVIAVCTSPEMRDMSPREIVPLLADKGEYIASEASFYRILGNEQMLQHRERSAPKTTREPNNHLATGPNQVWSWDITFLKTDIRGRFFKAYVFLDIFSRQIVGARVFEDESSEIAAQVFQDLCDKIGVDTSGIVLHSDNGSSMKGGTMLALLYELGVIPSFSRPNISDDNPYSESLFRTMKYHVKYPSSGFASVDAAQEWMDDFVYWYNNVHRHSGIKYVTPAERHEGRDREILIQRTLVYQQAKERKPFRWSGKIRDWSYIERVELNRRNSRMAK
jgi:transposase InsO family protein